MAQPEPMKRQRPENQLRLFDTLAINEFTIAFSGDSELLPEQPYDAEMIDAIGLGQRVRMTVDGYVKIVAGKAARGKEGDLNKVRKVVSVVIDSIDVSSFVLMDQP